MGIVTMPFITDKALLTLMVFVLINSHSTDLLVNESIDTALQHWQVAVEEKFSWIEAKKSISTFYCQEIEREEIALSSIIMIKFTILIH